MSIISKIKQLASRFKRVIVIPPEFPAITFWKICSAWKLEYSNRPDGSRVIPYDKDVKLLLKVAKKLGKKFHVLLQ